MSVTVSSSVMLTFTFVAALISVAFAQQPFPTTFPVPKHDRCPRGCSSRVNYCIKDDGCKSCKDCVACGSYGSPICPVKGGNWPLAERFLGACLGNLDLTTAKAVDSFGFSRGICGCNPPAEQLSRQLCTGGKSPNPKAIPVVRTPPPPGTPAKPSNKFFVDQYMACPTKCASQFELVCMKRKVCNYCTDCELCGAYGGLPCAPGVLANDKKCRNNQIELPITADFPKLPPNSNPWPVATVCGCEFGLVQDDRLQGTPNRCYIPSPPPPPSPPVYTSSGRISA